MKKSFSDLGISLPKDATGQVKILCPKCSADRNKSDEPCLSVNVEEGTYFCHHCGWHGSTKGAGYDNYSNATLSVNPVSESQMDECYKYLHERGISKKVVDRNHIYGFVKNDKTGIAFPFFQDELKVNTKYRMIDKSEFWQDRGGKQIPYKIDDIQNQPFFIFVEGELDALSFEVAGFLNAISVPSGAVQPESQNADKKLAFLSAMSNQISFAEKVILALDNDAPGIKTRDELARRIGYDKCCIVEYPVGCKDANDVLVRYGKEAVANLIADAKPYPVTGIHSVNDLRKDVIGIYQNGFEKGASTGFKSVDKLFTVRPGEMTCVTGTPGSGKSEFLDQLNINLFQTQGWPIAYYSPENHPPYRHMVKLADKYLKKSVVSDSKERISKQELDNALDDLSEAFHFIAPEDENATLDFILSRFATVIRRYGVKICVIDPWNQVEHFRPRELSETEYIGMCLTKIKRFAINHGVHMFVLAHPTKVQKGADGNYPVITAYDIAGSANWFNKSDNILSVQRHFKNAVVDQTPGVNRVTIHVQKIRFKEIGKLGSVTLNYIVNPGYYAE